MSFAHLHLHTEHSLLDGLTRIPDHGAPSAIARRAGAGAPDMRQARSGGSQEIGRVGR